MKSRKLSSLLFGFVSVVLALISVTTAFAAEPYIEAFHDEGSVIVADCGNFLALEDFEIDGRATIFFDQAGIPVKVQVHVKYDGTLTNSVTGLTLRDPSDITIVADLQEGTTTYVGLAYNITVPGEGIALLDAGKLVFDADGNVTYQAGPHQFLNGGLSLICAALD